MKATRYLSLLPLVCWLASLSLAAESAGPDALPIAADVKGALIVHEKLLDETDDATGQDLHAQAKGLSMPVAHSEILSADENHRCR